LWTSVTLRPWNTLRTGITLRTGVALCAWSTLVALIPLRTLWSLRASGSLWAGLPAGVQLYVTFVRVALTRRAYNTHISTRFMNAKCDRAALCIYTQDPSTANGND
jgi:hypothetical protein